jgi:hypothetical protein
MRYLLLAAALLATSSTTAAQTDLSCPYRARPALASRLSPLDSVTFQLGGQRVRVCYGRPSARGRTMIGGQAVPFGRVWRTGANETTKIRSPVPLTIVGIAVPAGTYALYTVPGEQEWQVIVNRAWEQWGQEDNYTDEVRAQEAGRATVPVERVAEHVEVFTIRAEPRGDAAVDLVLEWERTRVRVPVVMSR